MPLFDPSVMPPTPPDKGSNRTGALRSDMILECVEGRDWRMLIAFQDSDRADGCGVYLEIPELGSWSWSEGKKNSLRCLRSTAPDILRPQDTARAGSLVWRYASVSGDGGPASRVPQLWSCEAGEAGLDCRQSAVHQTVRLLCGPAMPSIDVERRSQRTALGLADGQGFGDAVYARATTTGGVAGTASDRH
jgi:hypothetical protein